MSEEELYDDEDKAKAFLLIPELMSLDGERLKRDVDEAKYCLGLATAAAIFTFREIDLSVSQDGINLFLSYVVLALLTSSLLTGYFAYRYFYTAEQAAFTSRFNAKILKSGLEEDLINFKSFKVSKIFEVNAEHLKKLSTICMIFGLVSMSFVK